MTISYALGFEPLWLLMDENSTPAGGGYLVSRRSLNFSDPKPIYQDPAGAFAYPNGSPIPGTYAVLFDMNGVAPGPFYFSVDSTQPQEMYFLQAYNAQGTLLWQIENYLPGGGGGSTVTEAVSLVNYIANNQFLNHIGMTNTSSMTNLVVAPSNHQGFTPAPSTALALSGTFGVVGPDIRFLKNSTANTDSIDFLNFPLGSSPFSPDVTPVRYLSYACTSNNPGETYKCFQFPITQKVQNLSNQAMTFRVWAAVVGTPVALDLYTRQYYGSGTGATVESDPGTRNLVGTTPTLSAVWTLYTIKFTMPNVSGKTIGAPGSQTDDDAIYLQLSPPLNSMCNVLFSKPALYLGSISPSQEFEDYDQINSINSTARCGDVRVGLTLTAPLGWLVMDDTTIGNTGSTATTKGDFTFQLYATLYTSVSDTWAPVSGGRTGGGTTIANAITDFLANKTLTLPKSLGRVLANMGTGPGPDSFVLGQNAGEQKHTLTIPELAAHTHGPGSGTAFFNFGGANKVSTNTGSNASTTATTATTGSSTPFNVMQPTSFMNVYIKL